METTTATATTTTTATTTPFFTSTTAPGKQFASRTELAEHYKSDWHKYNLKRREAGLPLLEEADFLTRWSAALALRNEKEAKEKSSGSGTDHLKNKKQQPKKKQQPQQKEQNKQTPTEESSATTATSKSVITWDASTKDNVSSSPEGEETTATKQKQKVLPPGLAESQENPDIDPKQSLFDSFISDSLEENVKYMQKKYGFFIPDQECLLDLEGLLGYCHEKIKLGHYCLYCEKVFPTWQGCQKHMISKQHTKLRYEQGFWEELDPFYNFEKDNANFIMASGNASGTGTGTAAENEEEGGSKDPIVTDDEEEEGGWEDVSEDGNDKEKDDNDDDDLYNAYEAEVAKFGLDVTPLGELVFPDGRIVGHRALRKYYNQRPRPANSSNSTAIIAAKAAAGERLYEGRVIDIHDPLMTTGVGAAGKNKKNSIGNGILVPLGGGVSGFSALSLYRFRAAVQKQRRGETKGLRLWQKSSRNMNRMDKKANRLMNGVSVAHAAR